MTRPPRLDIAGIPQHVAQRGNNRLPCFLDDEDRQRYLQCLRQALLRFNCRLHAHVLMSNHAHLLVTTGEAGALARMMHTFGRNYACAFNARHGRTGTLWEDRYKACLVDSDRYFLVCSRYIELNPVRAWMVAKPAEHAWSSYAANATGRVDTLITPHPVYLALGPDTAARAAAYRALFADNMQSDELLAEIRDYLQQQKVLGTDRFRHGSRPEPVVSPPCDRPDDPHAGLIVPDTIITDHATSSLPGPGSRPPKAHTSLSGMVAAGGD